jgi:capsular exopolysaccharide synthesis family protein
MRGSVEMLKSQMADRRKEIAQQTYGQYASGLQQAAAKAVQEHEAVQKRYNAAKNEARQLETDINKITTLRQKIEDLDKSITRLDDEIRNRTIMMRPPRLGEPPSVSPVSIVAKASIPRERVLPKWKVMAPVAVFVGLLLGFGLAFLVELSDTSVKSPSDMARRVDVPLLGMVPHGEDMDEEIENFRKALLAAPHSPTAEAFRQIRTNLLFSGPAQTRRSILVTSPSPEDGRTSVVINLAVSFAQAGRKVLIVDANFRQPAIAQEFPQAPPAGLSSALVGQVNWRDAVGQTEVPNLYVMASGPRPPNPTELLGSEAMRQIVAEMAAEYDQVLLDGSPAMLVSDARVLSTAADGVIVVVRAGANYGLVQRSVEQLSRVGAHVIGCVLNDVRITAGGYLRKNYESFYEYHQQSLPESQAKGGAIG